MPPAAKRAPGEILFALVICACPIVLAFLVKPALTKWIVFGVGVVMFTSVLGYALKPSKG
jgi:hypothetical protein